ncbi:hypothetical protein FRC08_018054 [Ceratobasidium sp. 394]|nr:hypothetical protein FRC08_018054 [Ceratobasidium sp. 394]KAG9094788.1 hypothetical protein FS749_011836 [Ceratobasidium sp. UAMH 11750]
MVVLSLFLFLAILSPSLAALVPDKRAEPTPRGCGFEASPAFVQAAESHFAAAKLSAAQKQATSKGKVKVYWHVIMASKTLADGNIPDSQINASIKATNSHYAKSGLSLELASIDRTTNETWFKYVAPRLPTNTAMKQLLRKGGPADLNVYTVGFKGGPGKGLLGYSTFPSAYEANKTDDGVVIQYATLPGGTYPNFNQGKTLTHELGHWLGLYHPFQGDSCTGDGDFVKDTPPERTPTSGCPAKKDTCPGNGPDPIHNYMDYSYDSCLTGFTPGQIQRFKQQIRLYRGIDIPN